MNIKIELYPPPSETGMQTGRLPTGVKVTDLDNGNIVICTSNRHMHRNKAAAIAAIESLKENSEHTTKHT